MKYPRYKYILSLNDIKNLKEIYIYGTGVSAKQFANLIYQNNLNLKVLGFIDSYKQSNLDEIKTYNINDFKDIDKTIIICTYYEEWIDEIIHMLTT